MAMLAADFSSARRSDWTLPVAMYGAYLAVCVFALHPTALSMAKTWLSSSSYHHGVAVAPLALLMIMTRPRIDPATGPLSLVAIVGAAFIWLAGRAAGVALVEQFAFVTLLIAGAWMMFGSGAAKLWALPLLFLYFMVPFGEVLIPFLQMLTASAVTGLLNFLGVDAVIDGTLIRTEAGLFEIAKACAGLNFLLAALMVACVYASQTLHRFKTRIAFVMIAAAVALIANFLRAFLLILIATVSDMRYAVGPDHLLLGLVLYAAVFFILFWIGAKMRKPQGVGFEHAPVRARRAWRFSVAMAALVPVAAVSAYAAFFIDFGLTLPAPPKDISLSAPGWRVLPAPQNWTPRLNADKTSSATYEKLGERVYVSLGYIVQDRQDREILNVLNSAADGDDWRKIADREEVVYLFGESKEIPLEILAGPDRRRLLVMTAYWRGGDVYTNTFAFKWAQMIDKLKGVNPPGGIIMIAADYAGDLSEALTRIRSFTADIESFAEWQSRMRLAP
ncbi:exosortase A [Marinicaulis aureus]|uniref:Exosortase A n=1 Tax=Hyphococcus aureus TaxID=2666033 RepID=A0ABW1KWS5_9PROT